MAQLLDVQDLVVHFPVRGGVLGQTVARVHAVDGVSLTLAAGETLGLVGESGCGKTTLGRAILRLIAANRGKVLFEGEDFLRLNRRDLKRARRRMQMVFQDPYAALNPRKTILDLVGEGLVEHGLTRTRLDKEERVSDLLAKVGLGDEALHRFPHEFSGGQRQRICIARAISLNPSLLVCDEAVSALDVSIQVQILDLLKSLQQALNMAYLFIGHDLAVVKSISDRIAVMYLGQIVELAKAEQLFASARHPYTRSLLSAVPIPDPKVRKQRIILSGDVPTPVNPPQGCRFHPRCPEAKAICKEQEPVWRVTGDHGWKCHF